MKNEEIFTKDNKQLILGSYFIKKDGIPYMKYVISNILRNIDEKSNSFMESMESVNLSSLDGYLRDDLLVVFKCDIDLDKKVINLDEIDYFVVNLGKYYDLEDYKKLTLEMSKVPVTKLSDKNLEYLISIMSVKGLMSK